MTYEDLIVLIPSHSMEDFPTEVGDEEAAGLLNAFSVLWHPLLLAGADTLPNWHRSDEPPETLENRLVVIPKSSEEWLPGGWAGFARKEGAVVIEGKSDRTEMVQLALEPLESQTECDPELIADFHALGTCWLMIELLTTHMHHYSNLDELDLQREAIAGAKAAVEGDGTAARAHLRNGFEMLQEARERFYPVECFLIDLCLLIPRQANEHLDRSLDGESPFNLLVSASDLQVIADNKPEVIEKMKRQWDAGRLDVAGGELHDRPSPLLPMESALWDFQYGREVFRKLLARTPTTWGRRRFGFTTTLPQILNKFGYQAALHVALDDGIYPDAEQSKIRWEGCDGTVIDAVTRIPLPALSAASYVRFPQRMAESMEEDHVAAVLFARWPEETIVWFDDLQRIHSYAPVLGRFVTFEEFFEQTEDPGRMSGFEAGEYFGPYLLRSVAYEEKDPLSRFALHVQHRHRFEEAAFFDAIAAILCHRRVPESEWKETEHCLETTGPGEPDFAEDDSRPQHKHTAIEASGHVNEFHKEAADKLANVILSSSGNTPGYLILNSLAFQRRVVVDLPGMAGPPDVAHHVKGVQFDDSRKLVSLDLPPCGFVWLPRAGAGHPVAAPHGDPDIPLAEEDMLRNELFEVWINDRTGGIGRIKGYGRTPNRLSQQVGFRYRDQRSWIDGEGADAEKFTSYYAEMRRRATHVRSTGPLLGEVETEGDIIDQTNQSKLAGYRQTMRVWRGLPLVEVELELDVSHMPDGDPWTSYYGLRFAYNDITASLTRSVQQGAQGFRGQRFDSVHYLEIASDEQRTTIAFNGMPYHRKTGDRMFDTLLIVPGETQRTFRFRIAVDVDYPMHPAMDLLTPPTILPTETGPPQPGNAGWFFHVSAKNVLILRVMDLTESGERKAESGEESSQPAVGCAVRLLETEGRGRTVKLRCPREPTSARQRDFQGRTINELPVEGDAVFVEMTGHEIADVEVLF